MHVWIRFHETGFLNMCWSFPSYVLTSFWEASRYCGRRVLSAGASAGSNPDRNKTVMSSYREFAPDLQGGDFLFLSRDFKGQ